MQDLLSRAKLAVQDLGLAHPAPSHAPPAHAGEGYTDPIHRPVQSTPGLTFGHHEPPIHSPPAEVYAECKGNDQQHEVKYGVKENEAAFLHQNAAAYGEGTGSPGARKASFGAGFTSNPIVAGISNRLQTFQQEYLPSVQTSSSSLKSIQMGITSQKTVVLAHETLARDISQLSKHMDSLVKELPVGALIESEAQPAVQSDDTNTIYHAPATQTLLQLNLKLSNLHTVLGKQLNEAREPLKELRNLERSLEEKEASLAHLHKQHHSRPHPNFPTELEKLQTEIEGLRQVVRPKGEDSVREGERKRWEAYGEFAKDLLLLSHAASILVPLLPSGSQASMSKGEQQDKVRQVEEGVRRGLGGLEGGWKVKVEEGGLISGKPTRQNSMSSLRPSIPPHLASDLSPVAIRQTDTIGLYPSSHISPIPLNNNPAPIPSPDRGSPTSAGTIPLIPAHKHRSSFDHPIGMPHRGSVSGLSGSALDTTHEGVISPTPVHNALPLLTPPALATHTSAGVAPPISNDIAPGTEALGQHPTIAETGIPIVGGTGPASGQLERKEKSGEVEVVRLGSFGGEATVPEPPKYQEKM